MDIKVFPSTFHGKVELIGSKSLSHRYLIGAALGSQESHLEGLMDSDDLDATKTILQALGASIKLPLVQGPLKKTSITELNTQASGSTLRFLIPLALTLDASFVFKGTGRLPKRSLKAYEDCFKDHDVTFERLTSDFLPLHVKGPLKPGVFKLSADVSSQFVSGLLFALPFLKGDSVIELDTPIASMPYFEMTLNVLREFGLRFEYQPERIKVPGFQTIQPLSKTIEGDYSQALFFAAGAILGGDLILTRLPEHSLQGDAKLWEVFRSLNFHFQHQHQTIQIASQEFDHFHLDLEDTIDAAPMLMLMSAFGKNPSTFKSLSRLQEKESDRYDAITKTLKQMNITFHGDEQETTILPQTSFASDIPFDTFDDHRMAMALMMCAPKATSPYIVKGVECIDKSYPNFLSVYQSIGGQFKVLGEKS